MTICGIMTRPPPPPHTQTDTAITIKGANLVTFADPGRFPTLTPRS